MEIKAFYEKENLLLQSPMSGVQCPESAFCPMSNVYCLMSDFSDFMHFRYYASTMGRFLKPDNLIPDITNPQNWNAYSYVKGNPVNFNDPTGHEEKTFDMTNKPQGAGMSASNPITGEPDDEKEAVLPTDQPKKVGDDLFKLTLDVSALAAIATDKAANPTLTQSAAKTAKDWGLVLKQPEFKAAGKILGGVGAILDTISSIKNVRCAPPAGIALTSKERISLYTDIAIGIAIVGTAAVLEGPSICISSLLLVPAAFKLGTDVGKLVNSGLPYIPSEAAESKLNSNIKIPNQRWPGVFF
jgi:RHS repeat-associated protein